MLAERFSEPSWSASSSSQRRTSPRSSPSFDERDYALRAVASCLRSALRATDVIARYGGEEFAVLPGACVGQAREVANACAALSVKCRSKRSVLARPRVTVSIGVAQMSAPEPSAAHVSHIASAVTQVLADSFIEQADQALYRAKERGRDRVEV